MKIHLHKREGMWYVTLTSGLDLGPFATYPHARKAARYIAEGRSFVLPIYQGKS
jgi:hypothetical protein